MSHLPDQPMVPNIITYRRDMYPFNDTINVPRRSVCPYALITYPNMTSAFSIVLEEAKPMPI